jgi:hypothetical protein
MVLIGAEDGEPSASTVDHLSCDPWIEWAASGTPSRLHEPPSIKLVGSILN